MTYRIGIDIGGTFTDAVAVDRHGAVVAAVKTPTQHPPGRAIGRAIDLLTDNGLDIATVGLVSLATTVATNALVEGTGGPVGLIFAGFREAEAQRGGLPDALGDGPLITVAGGHDAHGRESEPLDLDSIVAEATNVVDRVDAYAVTARFAVRNPAHELAIKEALLPLGKPVTCGHELAAALDGPRRALTCVLNAGLTGLAKRLCTAANEALTERGIAAPLLIVGSDGSVMSAEVAVERPIQTILSGPAASLAGAAHLLDSPTGLPPLLTVADIGGTTTDIGLVHNGRPRVSESGATVGGHRTMVDAVEVHTIGLGGDSLIDLNLRGTPELIIGPRRVRPLSDLAVDEPTMVLDALARVRLPYRPGATTFVTAQPVAGVGHRLSEREQALLSRLVQAGGWQPLAEAAARRLDRENLEGLLAKGRVAMAGFTPTDAALVVGLGPESSITTDRPTGETEAAIEAATVLASASTTKGEPVAASGFDLARWIVDEVARRSAEAVLAANLAADGLDTDLVTQPLIQEMLDRRHRELTSSAPSEQADGRDRQVLDITVAPRGPLVGLGAGSNTYHPQAAAMLRIPAVSPTYGPVAGAVGAAVGEVRVTSKATITQPTRGQYRVHLPEAGDDRGDLQPAIDEAVAILSNDVGRRARRAGAAQVELAVDVEERTAEVGGKRILVEATVTVTGTGPAQTAEV